MTQILNNIWETIKFIPNFINSIASILRNTLGGLNFDFSTPLISVIAIILVIFIYRFLK